MRFSFKRYPLLHRLVLLFLGGWMILGSAGDPLLAKELILEIGSNYGPQPKGEFADLLPHLERSPRDAGRLAVRYLFNNGLTRAREAFRTSFYTSPAKNELLVVTHGGFTLGWAFEGDERYFIEFAIPEPSLVSLRSKYLQGEARRSDLIDATWGGVAVEFGGTTFGLLLSMRYVQMRTKDAFGLGLSLDATGINLGLGLGVKW